jgi:1,4-dihydroxy-2-naphthoyl-CoA hydrolase
MNQRPPKLELQGSLRDLMSTPSPFDQLYGLEFVACSEELVEGRVPVHSQVTQPFGIVHGGVYASIAEALASTGTNLGLEDGAEIGVGLSNQTSFLRPILKGHINGTARRRHRGRTTWLWEVELTDDDSSLCALTRITMAIRQLK